MDSPICVSPRGAAHRLVVVDLNDLIDPEDRDDTSSGTPAATARLLWRLAGGRRRQSTARIQMLTCDAKRISILTDGNTPLAIGDAYDPIPAAIRRAATAAIKAVAFQVVIARAQMTDLHHVIWREHRGPTELANLVSFCRFCHNLAHKKGWQLTLHPDGRVTVSRGRWRFTSHPRLRPPPPRPPPSRTPPPEHPTVDTSTSHADPELPF